jgi:hypothetical protein
MADQYDLPELKVWCGQQLATTVDKTNYAELLRLAELYDIKLLKTAVVKYIAGHADHLVA